MYLFTYSHPPMSERIKALEDLKINDKNRVDVIPKLRLFLIFNIKCNKTYYV